ncbi:hypothetical protein ES707_11966 [subsurface metagenome]
MGYGGGGGAASFLDLTDTPETYAGQALKLVKVNVGETALSLDLLLSFTDWYAGALPTDYPWVFEANNPVAADSQFSAMFRNAIGQYVCYAGMYNVQRFYRYNLTTKQWHRLADPPVVLIGCLSHSPDEKKLAALSVATNILRIYDIEANTWTSSPAAPQMDAVDVTISSCVWADDDTIWCQVNKSATSKKKCYKYVVSTSTWTQYTNDLTPADAGGSNAMAITPDGTTLYFAPCGADYNDCSKYVISTDTYSLGVSLGASNYFPYAHARHFIWYGSTVGGYAQIINYIKCEDESTVTGVFPTNPQRNKPTSLRAAVYGTTRVIVFYRTTEPKNMSYSGTGYWKLGQQVLTDYNLVVFKKPADGYAILAIDKVNNHTVPIYIFSTLVLPAGTWEFFYPKDGDYTQLKISGSVLK